MSEQKTESDAVGCWYCDNVGWSPAHAPVCEAKCPRDGQTRAYHLHVGGTHHDGTPRTNGEFIGCDFGNSTTPGAVDRG